MKLLEFVAVVKNKSFWIILALMLTIIIDVMGMGLVFPLLPGIFMSKHSALLPFATSIRLRHIFYGIGMAAWPLGIFFGTPYLGDLSDKIGRKRVIMLCLAGTAMTYVFSAVAVLYHLLWVFIFSRLFSGFFAGSFVIAQAVVADVSDEDKKARNMGWITMAASVGIVMGPVITSLVTATHVISLGLTGPFWFAGVLSFLNVVCIYFLLKETFVVNNKVKISLLKAVGAFRFIFADKRTYRLALVFLTLQMGWGFYVQSVPLVLQQLFHYHTSGIGLFFAVLGVGCIVGLSILQPPLIKRFSLKTIYIASAFVVALALLYSVVWPTLINQWIALIFVSTIELLCYSCSLTMFSNAVSEQEQGRVMGGTGAIFGVAWVLNALLIGGFISIYIFLPIIFAVTSIFVSGGLLMRYRK